MADFKIIINSQVFKIYPYGLCRCGCGQKTNIAGLTQAYRKIVKGRPFKFIKGHYPKGENNPSWKGGTRQGKNRHIQIYAPSHPQANNGGYVFGHRLIAEKALGKLLPKGVVVHHHSLTQLVVCEDQVYHVLLHTRQKALRACGHVNYRKCWICQEWGDPANMKENSNTFHHAECKSRYRKERR